MTKKNKQLRVGLVVPHIFMQQQLLSQVIFSPSELALTLASELNNIGVGITLFTPGPVNTTVPNITADLSLFEEELSARNDGYLDLLKKHPVTFISLARQVQAELIALAFEMANSDKLDVVHIYTNEEDIALPFIKLCKKPVVLTHHDPFNFLVRYRSIFPKYRHLNWLALSESQKKTMHDDTNWLGTIYHGMDTQRLKPLSAPSNDYIAYLGRIIEPKGVHLAIAAIKKHNQRFEENITLKIAGKHYSGHTKDSYWKKQIEPMLGESVQYLGHLKTDNEKQAFLGNARSLIMPSTFEEPFGMVMIESLACGTPVIGLKSGAIPEVINDGQTGILVTKNKSQLATVEALTEAIHNISSISRKACRENFEARFSAQKMASQHLDVYKKLQNN